MVRTDHGLAANARKSLNPFFIRSMVRTGPVLAIAEGLES